MIKDNYEAAIIGCHGSGKTTICDKLSRFYKLYPEDSINYFMGKNPFLSEMKIILNYSKMNDKFKKEEDNFISDRHGLVSILIYAKSFKELGWIDDKQYNIINHTINNSDVDWVFPKKFLYVNEDLETIKSYINIRNRQGLKEEDNNYLVSVLRNYKDFSSKTLQFELLNKSLQKEIHSIPIKRINSNTNLETIIKTIKTPTPL